MVMSPKKCFALKGLSALEESRDYKHFVPTGLQQGTCRLAFPDRYHRTRALSSASEKSR